MDLEFENPKHEKLVNDFRALTKRYDRKGQTNAEEIIGTIDVLRAAPTLFDVPRSFRPHPLDRNYKGYFAVDVTATHRVVFRPNENGNPNFRIDNYKTISRIAIAEIFTDYH